MLRRSTIAHDVVLVSRVARSSKAMSYTHKKMPYASAVEAVVESALVTWIGLLFYEVTALAPEGHYTVCIPDFTAVLQALTQNRTT